MSPAESRRFFWPSVHGFSIYYSSLALPEGQRFLKECKEKGKRVCAWTVNDREGMRECIRWGVDSCITDKPGLWREVKAEVSLLIVREGGRADISVPSGLRSSPKTDAPDLYLALRHQESMVVRRSKADKGREGVSGKRGRPV